MASATPRPSRPTSSRHTPTKGDLPVVAVSKVQCEAWGEEGRNSRQVPQQETSPPSRHGHAPALTHYATFHATTNLPVVAVSKVQCEARRSDRLEALLRYGVGSWVQVQTHQVLQLLHMQTARSPGFRTDFPHFLR